MGTQGRPSCPRPGPERQRQQHEGAAAGRQQRRSQRLMSCWLGWRQLGECLAWRLVPGREASHCQLPRAHLHALLVDQTVAMPRWPRAA